MGNALFILKKNISRTQIIYIDGDPLNKLIVSCSGSDIIRLACNPKIHFGLHESLLLIHILSYLETVQITYFIYLSRF